MYSIRSILIFLTFSLAVSFQALSQGRDREQSMLYVEIAEEIMKATSALDDAREQMVTAADLDTTFSRANYEAGQLHLNTINKDRATKYLLRVYRQEPAYRFDLEYYIGKSYQYGLDFDKAINFYNRYIDKLKKKSDYKGKDKISLAQAERALKECYHGKDFVANPRHFSITNIGREINSEFDDYAPVLNEEEDEIVFTTRRRDDNLNQDVFEDNKPWEDIFMAKKIGGKWTSAKNIGTPVNTEFHNSTLALSADGKTLFITNDEGGGDIYFSELKNGTWSVPAPLPGDVNSSYEEKSMSISADGKTIYFSSQRPGGYGGVDIYKATQDKKGNWINVENLGSKINTRYDEDGPFIDYDGHTLYFSSMGHQTMGGYDVFKSTYNTHDKQWSEPQNLGYPINTPDHDLYFVTTKDTKRSYYSSIREDGMGYQDIYMITIAEGLKNLEPVVLKRSNPDSEAEAKRKQELEKQAEAKRQEELVKQAEAKRQAELAKQAEAIRQQELAKQAEAKRQQELTMQAEAKRKLENEAEAKRQQELAKQAEAKRKLELEKEAEAKRQQELAKQAELKRKQEQEAEAKRQQELARQAELKKKSEVKPIKYIVTIVDAESLSGMDAKVSLVGAKDNVIVPLTNKGKGIYEFNVNSNKPKEYRLSVEKEGYLFQNFLIKLDGATDKDKTVNRKIELRKISVGATSILRNLYFDFDKATFKTESYTELNKLESMLRQNDRMVVEIGGHTDAVGTYNYNIFLSRKRAEAVKDYLTKKGIDSRRVKAVGYGKSKPLASNDDEEEGRELNRRVEFKVLSN